VRLALRNAGSKSASLRANAGAIQQATTVAMPSADVKIHDPCVDRRLINAWDDVRDERHHQRKQARAISTAASVAVATRIRAFDK